MTRISRPLFVLTLALVAFGASAVADLVPFPADDLLDTPWYDGPKVAAADQELVAAIAMLEIRNYENAARRARAYLESNPDSATAHEILGTALMFDGRTDDGLRSLQEAHRLAPDETSPIIKIGDVFMVRGEYGKAGDQYARAIELAPDNLLAHRRLGLLLDNRGDFEPAISHYRRGLSAADNPYMQTRIRLARLYNLTGRYRETVELFGDNAPEVSTIPAANFVLGNAHLGLNEVDQAISSFEIAARLDPESQKAHLALGIVYRLNGEYERSLEELRAATRAQPDLPEGYLQTGETLLQMNRFDEALRSFEKAAAASSNPVFVRHRVAEAYIDQNQRREAIAVYRELIASDQAVLATYDLLATVYQMDGRIEEAEETLKAATAAYPRDHNAFFRLGFYYGTVKKFDQAIAQFERALDIAPEDVQTLLALSSAYRQQDDQGKAIQSARKLVRIDPALSNKLYLAALYQEAGFDELAIKLYDEILAEEPKHPVALNNIASSLSSSGNHEKALEYAQKAAEVLPGNGIVLDTLGWIQFKQGNLDDAIDSLQKAAAASTNNPTIHYHLGMAYEGNNNTTLALKQFDRALALQGDFPERDDAIARREVLLSRANR